MITDAKYKFLSELERVAEVLYRQGDSISHDEAWERRRSFLWGFGQAGKTIQLVTSEDIQRTIDQAHERVYSESRAARMERLSPMGDGSEEPDCDAFDSPTFDVNQIRWVDVMCDFFLGYRPVLFSPCDFEVILSEHDFFDSQAALDRLNELYADFILHSDDAPPMTRKQIKAQLSSVSKNAKRLKMSLYLPLYERASLYARSRIDWQKIEATLVSLADEAEKLASELQKDTAGRRSPVKNQFIVDLAGFYEEYTGLKASSYTHKPQNVVSEQYQGKGLSFIRSCLDKAEIGATDEAIVQVIKRMDKSKGHN